MQLAESRFAATGIVPFNRKTFSDEEFSAVVSLTPEKNGEVLLEQTASLPS